MQLAVKLHAILQEAAALPRTAVAHAQADDARAMLEALQQRHAALRRRVVQLQLAHFRLPDRKPWPSGRLCLRLHSCILIISWRNYSTLKTAYMNNPDDSAGRCKDHCGAVLLVASDMRRRRWLLLQVAVGVWPTKGTPTQGHKSAAQLRDLRAANEHERVKAVPMRTRFAFYVLLIRHAPHCRKPV